MKHCANVKENFQEKKKKSTKILSITIVDEILRLFRQRCFESPLRILMIEKIDFIHRLV